MNRFRTPKIHTFLLLIFFYLLTTCTEYKKEDPVRVLILSGKNNHEWQKTTPALIRIFKDPGLFNVSVTETPDSLTYKELEKYDILLSNWNSWPDNDFRMPEEGENDLLKYVNDGGGILFLHAGASSFYGWEDYHRMGIGRWGENTSHGKPTTGKVYDFDQDHPITKGFSDFFIVDELWERTDIYPGVPALAFLTASDETDGHPIHEPAVFVNHIGKGRTFYTILGHDERALLNSGLQKLILRAAQWCSGREVTIEPPIEFKSIEAPATDNFTWIETDSSLILRNHHDIIWQFNFNNRFGKTYFHPLAINNSSLTCIIPPDHPWHLGLWFSWKYINGVNYWEYLDDFKSEETGYKSAGITEFQKKEIKKNPDFSALIRLELIYHPAGSTAVMSEIRNISLSPPFKDGSYFIDYECFFNALADEVILDRTPIEGEQGGVSWGGYAGLSIRFNQDYTSPLILHTSENDNYEMDSWLYMGFNTLTGEKTGLCIMQNPEFTAPTTRWYVINDPEIPFYYFSPAILYTGKIILKKHEILHLKYRIFILPGTPEKGVLQSKYEEYMKETGNL